MAKQPVSVILTYDGQQNDHTADVLIRDGISITHGKADESSQPAPATAELSLRGWDFNPANPASPLFGKIGRNTPLDIVHGIPIGTTRFDGEVSSWTPRQSLGGPGQEPDRWVEAVAAGITRRLGQGQDPLRDAVTRYCTVGAGAANLVGFWPMAAGDSPRSRDAVVGQPMRMLDIAPGTQLVPESNESTRHLRLVEAQLAPWMAPGASVNGTVPPPIGLLPGQVAVSARLNSGATTRLTIEAAYRYTSGNLENRAGHQVILAAGDDDFRMDWFTNNFNGLPVGSGGAEETNPDWRFTMRIGTSADSEAYERIDLDHHNELVDGSMHVIRVDMSIAAAANELDWTVHLDGLVLDSGTVTSFPLDTFQATQVNLETRTIHIDKLVYGPVAVWAGTPPPVAESRSAFLGHAGEHAGRRIERLCDEEGELFAPTPFAADLDDTIPCGPQYPDGFLAILREAATTDGGILTDQGTISGRVSYRPGRTLYNQSPALALDYAAGEVAPPLEPTLDDQATRNDVTVTRRDGGQAQKVDEDSVAEVGRYTTGLTLNVMADGMLGDQAGWRLHLGTVEGTRFPRLSVDLDANPDLDVGDLVEGDRVTIDNLPPELSPDLANLVVLGLTETIGSHRRRITYNCVPEGPYHIAEVEHPDYGIIGSDRSTLLVEFAAGTDTALLVDLPDASQRWVHEGDFDIVVGGVRLTATAVAPFGSVDQEFTVVQVPVNGVVKTVPAGTAVDVFHKSYIGL